MKVVFITMALCMASVLLGGCAMLGSQELEDIHISGDGSTLTWGERIYDSYGLVTEDKYIGKQLGVADAGKSWDSGSWIFELAGAEATQWLIEKPRAIMSIHTVYRARGVTDIPEGVISFQENSEGK